MKKCSYCGKEYPDEASVCVIDREPLESNVSTPHSDSEVNTATSPETTIQTGAETDVPDGFRCFGRFDPFDAARLLKRFETDEIRFLIDKIERAVETDRGIRKMGLIDIYVHQDDDERASKIFTEDWKL